VNSSGAVRIARDKAFAQFFLAQAGLPTIPTRVFRSLPELYPLGELPMLFKPNDGHGGAGISIVHSADEVESAYKLAREISPLVLGQPVIQQREFRIVVFDGRPLVGYEKQPLTLTGDGVRTMRELIATPSWDSRPNANVITKLLADVRFTQQLRRSQLEIDSILPSGRKFIPLPIANLAYGGTWRECLCEFSPEALEASVAAASALGLVMAGVDLFSDSPGAESFLINEVNGSPGLERLGGDSPWFDPLFERIEEYLAQHS
jgi:cyanophycin synthetase